MSKLHRQKGELSKYVDQLFPQMKDFHHAPSVVDPAWEAARRRWGEWGFACHVTNLRREVFEDEK